MNVLPMYKAIIPVNFCQVILLFKLTKMKGKMNSLTQIAEFRLPPTPSWPGIMYFWLWDPLAFDTQSITVHFHII